MLSCCTGDRLKGLDEDYGLCPVCKEHVGEDTCPECEGLGYIYETEGLPDSKKQEMAWQVAEMIVKDITNITLHDQKGFQS